MGLTGLKIDVQARLDSLWGLLEFVPGISSFYRLPLLGLWLPSIFKASGVASSHLTLILLPPTFTFKGPCDYIESTWVIQEKSPHLRTLTDLNFKVPFTIKVTYSEIQGLWCGHLWGLLFCLPQCHACLSSFSWWKYYFHDSFHRITVRTNMLVDLEVSLPIVRVGRVIRSAVIILIWRNTEI